ncbi:DUF1064 domain-containing protein [Brevibacillus migulae]|uniref:DUF1064 domain-containing protein n=1 Tax=Brevibacillus migulae TaxID=1644114 RepID=UPI00106EFC81|nr:DUF1064 domain-containing protein [Brevibacillus migulae]
MRIFGNRRRNAGDDGQVKQQKYKNKKVVVTRDRKVIPLDEAKRFHIDGLPFDSKAEAEYYLILLDKQERGEITHLTLQPKYELQPACVRWGENLQPIRYQADFEVEYPDGKLEAIDVKGLPSEASLLKFKMFQYHYPTVRLVLLKRVRGGSFVELKEYNKQKRAEKKGAKQ